MWYVFTISPCPFPGYISKADKLRIIAAEAREQARKEIVVEEELEVGLWRLNMWLEDFIYV
jgi:hypothetical protein